MPIEATYLSSTRLAVLGEKSVGSSRTEFAGEQGSTSALHPFNEQPPAEDTAVFSQAGLSAARNGAASAELDEEPAGLLQDPATEDLTEEEQRNLKELEKRDQEVRRHEQAHKAAAGSYARGGANLEYTTGPDGKRYASGGNVQIEVSAERTPQATIQKMKVIERAAMAPADPSAQDRAVYRSAVRQEQSAREQLAKEQRAQAENVGSTGQARPVAQTNDSLVSAAPQPLAPADTSGPAEQAGAAGDVTPGASEKTQGAAGPLAARVQQNALRPDDAANNGRAGISTAVPNATAQLDPLSPAKRPSIEQQGPPTATLDLRA